MLWTVFCKLQTSLVGLQEIMVFLLYIYYFLCTKCIKLKLYSCNYLKATNDEKALDLILLQTSSNLRHSSPRQSTFCTKHSTTLTNPSSYIWPAHHLNLKITKIGWTINKITLNTVSICFLGSLMIDLHFQQQGPPHHHEYHTQYHHGRCSSSQMSEQQHSYHRQVLQYA